MLYVSTRNVNNTYTAHRALHEATAPDGGMYVPYRMSVLSPEELATIKRQSAAETVAYILNLFFSLRISAAEVESFMGKTDFVFHEIPQNVLFAELWHTPEDNCNYWIEELFGMMTGNVGMPKGWAYIAVQIALLFGAYGAMGQKYRDFDMAVPADDLAELIAVLYAKEMGLPINRIICTCSENDAVWNLINNYEFSTTQAPAYMEYLIYHFAGDQGVTGYLEICERNGVYAVDEVLAETINAELYAAVVSSGRIDTVILSMYRANGYHIDAGTALLYGGLQDYRASVGANDRTVLLSKKRPECIKE